MAAKKAAKNRSSRKPKSPTGHGGRRSRAGRKTKAEEIAVAELMEASWPASLRRRVVSALHKSAVGGNVKAAALLFGYTYGTPRQVVEHEGEIEVKIVKVPPKLTLEEWLSEQSKSE